MDCRRCNFYLCESCQSTYKSPDTGFWGVVSSLIDSAAQEFSEMVNDITAFSCYSIDEDSTRKVATT